MRSRIALGALFSGTLFMALFAGCGDGEGDTTGAGGAGGEGQGSSSAQSSSSMSSTSGMSSSSTGTPMMGDGNDTIETAEEIDFDTLYEGELDPTGDKDFYRFEGKAGQAMFIDTDAEVIDSVRFDPSYIDTIIRLYGPDGKQIAENNNGIPSFNQDSSLYTILPADGTYSIRITECWSGSSSPNSTCLPTEEKDNTYYEFFVTELDPAFEGIISDTEKGNDAMSAEPIEYAKAQTGGYFFSDVYGTFTDKDDVDVFAFKMPSDISTSPGSRSTGYFYLIPPGKSGTGSTTPIGRMYIADAADPLVPIAEILGSQNTEMSPPLATDKDYLLFVEHPDLAYEDQDFYFFRHYGGPANPVESNEMANDDPLTADSITADPNGDGSFSAFIEGDLIMGATDVDHFKVAVPQTVGDTGTLTAVCSGQRRGSGLRNLLINVLAADGTPVAMGTVETASSFALVQNLDIPTGATELIVKFSAQQDPVVTSSFYRCGVHFNP